MGDESWSKFTQFFQVTLRANFFSKKVAFTKFLSKMYESEFPKFPHFDNNLYNAMWKFSRFFGKISVKSPFSLLIEYYYWRMNWFHEIFFEEEWISWFSTLRVTWQNVYRILFSWFFSKNSVKSNYFIIASYFYIAFTRFFQIILMT